MWIRKGTPWKACWASNTQQLSQKDRHWDTLWPWQQELSCWNTGGHIRRVLTLVIQMFDGQSSHERVTEKLDVLVCQILIWEQQSYVKTSTGTRGCTFSPFAAFFKDERYQLYDILIPFNSNFLTYFLCEKCSPGVLTNPLWVWRLTKRTAEPFCREGPEY